MTCLPEMISSSLPAVGRCFTSTDLRVSTSWLSVATAALPFRSPFFSCSCVLYFRRWGLGVGGSEGSHAALYVPPRAARSALRRGSFGVALGTPPGGGGAGGGVHAKQPGVRERARRSCVGVSCWYTVGGDQHFFVIEWDVFDVLCRWWCVCSSHDVGDVCAT